MERLLETAITVKPVGKDVLVNSVDGTLFFDNMLMENSNPHGANFKGREFHTLVSFLRFVQVSHNMPELLVQHEKSIHKFRADAWNELGRRSEIENVEAKRSWFSSILADATQLFFMLLTERVKLTDYEYQSLVQLKGEHDLIMCNNVYPPMGSDPREEAYSIRLKKSDLEAVMRGEYHLAKFNECGKGLVNFINSYNNPKRDLIVNELIASITDVQGEEETGICAVKLQKITEPDLVRAYNFSNGGKSEAKHFVYGKCEVSDTAQVAPMKRAIVLVIDVSGSMATGGMDKLISQQLSDYFQNEKDAELVKNSTLIFFSDEAGIFRCGGLDKDGIVKLIGEKCHGSGTTSFTSALKTLCQVACENAGRDLVTFGIFMSDGMSNEKTSSITAHMGMLPAIKSFLNGGRVHTVGFTPTNQITGQFDNSELMKIAEGLNGSVYLSSDKSVTDIINEIAMESSAYVGQLSVSKSLKMSVLKDRANAFLLGDNDDTGAMGFYQGKTRTNVVPIEMPSDANGNLDEVVSLLLPRLMEMIIHDVNMCGECCAIIADVINSVKMSNETRQLLDQVSTLARSSGESRRDTETITLVCGGLRRK